MVTTETWMGSGQSVTLAPESELFLGFMPLGPTLGREGTNKAHLIKYSLGYGLDGESVSTECTDGESFQITINDASDNGDATITIDSNANVIVGLEVAGTDIVAGTTVLTVNSATEIVLSQVPSSTLADGAALTLTQPISFTDHYNLVPDLYTGCTAGFYYTDSADAATLRFSAVVAGNDADAIYFSGNLNDYPNLFNNSGTPGVGTERGYIILSANGSIVPAPLSLEERVTITNVNAAEEIITVVANAGSSASFKAGDKIYNSSKQLVGEIWTCNAGATTVARADATTATTKIHSISLAIGTTDGTGSITAKRLPVTLTTSMTGKLTAGDWISYNGTNTLEASATILGKLISVSGDGLTITIAANQGVSTADAKTIFGGRDLPLATGIKLYTVSPRILSNNWIGLTNSVQTPTVEVETKQMNLALAGTRNYSYQYRGMETAGAASIDVNLNHGSWLYYAFGGLSSVSSTVVDTDPSDNHFESVGLAASAHEVYAGYATGTDRDYDSHSQNGKLHRVLKGTNTICPPLLPLTGMAKLTLPSDNGTTGIQNAITYTFSEKNDNKLPSFALELLTQKGSALDGTGKSLMVDRNTYSESVYAQIYPGCVVSDMTLTANENEELKASINLNVKRVFEAESGYVGKCYDATNNDTSEFKNLLNFGQQTGSNANITQTFIDPFFFSNGSITLFGQEFLKVSSFTLSLQNTLTDKRYIGQYNRQIKDYTPGQRTYEISISALVTDRRLFDELRRLSPHRFDLGEAADGSNAKIQLVFTKPNGESIRLEFDDYLVSASTWPIQDDRGPIQVDFTIMPLRTGTLNTVTHWVLQS
tara:strand:- start:4077 stop:6551 length:2475 start_codon:yes stop_codon:yes gene_type:complete